MDPLEPRATSPTYLGETDDDDSIGSDIRAEPDAWEPEPAAPAAADDDDDDDDDGVVVRVVDRSKDPSERMVLTMSPEPAPESDDEEFIDEKAVDMDNTKSMSDSNVIEPEPGRRYPRRGNRGKPPERLVLEGAEKMMAEMAADLELDRADHAKAIEEALKAGKEPPPPDEVLASDSESEVEKEPEEVASDDSESEYAPSDIEALEVAASDDGSDMDSSGVSFSPAADYLLVTLTPDGAPEYRALDEDVVILESSEDFIGNMELAESFVTVFGKDTVVYSNKPEALQVLLGVVVATLGEANPACELCNSFEGDVERHTELADFMWYEDTVTPFFLMNA